MKPPEKPPNDAVESAASSDSPPTIRGRSGIVRGLFRWTGRLLAAMSLSWIFFIVTPTSTWIHDRLDRQDPLRPAQYVICLGGDPARVIEAARLMRRGHGQRLIVSNYGSSADRLRDLAIEWGVPAERILVDRESRRTADHPEVIARGLGVDPAEDVCIVVTSYTHMARAKACFERAGYRHLIMRELSWERAARSGRERSTSWKSRYFISSGLIYEGAAWLEYWIRGFV